MEVLGVTPAQVRHMAPGTPVLVRAKFKSIDAVNLLGHVTVSNHRMSVRVDDIVAEVLPDRLRGAKFISPPDVEVPVTNSPPDEERRPAAEPPVPIEDDDEEKTDEGSGSEISPVAAREDVVVEPFSGKATCFGANTRFPPGEAESRVP